MLKCKYKAADKYCKLHNGYCGFWESLLCTSDGDREFALIMVALVIICLSCIGLLELMERGLGF